MLYINILFKNRTNKYIEKRKKMIHNHEVTSSILVLATKKHPHGIAGVFCRWNLLRQISKANFLIISKTRV